MITWQLAALNYRVWYNDVLIYSQLSGRLLRGVPCEVFLELRRHCELDGTYLTIKQLWLERKERTDV